MPIPERVNSELRDKMAVRLYEAIQNHGFTCVFIDGYVLNLLGNKWKATDVNCCVDAKTNINNVLKKLQDEPE